MSVGPFQILVIALIVLVLFGRGRISALMGDLGQGARRFREGLADQESGLLDVVESERATDQPVG